MAVLRAAKYLPVAAASLLHLASCRVVIGDAAGPCDIYGAAKTPCVAAHSMTRALYRSYAGPLYKLRKVPQNTTTSIGLELTGGIANTSAHDSFCADAIACVVEVIYDQSPQKNHLGLEGPNQRGQNINPLRNIQDMGVNFSDPRSKVTLGGKPVYAAFFGGAPPGYDGKPFIGQGYSNRSARGTAQWDEPETIYAVMGGNYFGPNCCFDYGNAETWNKSGTKCTDGSMEAVFLGGQGKYPKVGADLENGIYGFPQKSRDPNISFPFVATMVKGNSNNHFSVKVGNAQMPRSLQTLYNGARPKGYEKMRKQGAIILGIGGDNSPWASGIFVSFELQQKICRALVRNNVARAV